MHNQFEYFVSTRRVSRATEWEVIGSFVSLDHAILFRDTLRDHSDDDFDDVRLQDADGNLVFMYHK